MSNRSKGMKCRLGSNFSTAEVLSVVFSCWTKMLDLLEWVLESEGIDFARIDGKKTDSQRRGAMESFRKDTSCTVLLASIGSAGVG